MLKLATQAQTERAILVLLIATPSLTFIGAILGAISLPALQITGAVLTSLGLMCLAALAALTYPLDTIETLPRWFPRPTRTTQPKLWTTLKTIGITLNLFALVLAAALVGGILSRLGIVQLALPADVAIRFAGGGSFLLSLLAASALALDLCLPAVRRSTLPQVTAYVGIVILSVLLAFTAIFLAFFGARDSGQDLLANVHASSVIAAGFVCMGLALMANREWPTLFILFEADADHFKGETYISSQKSILLPAAGAISLLVLFAFALLSFGGHQGRLTGGALVVLIVLAVGSIVAGAVIVLRASKKPDDVPTYREAVPLSERMETYIIAASILLALLFWVPAFFLFLGKPILGMAPGRAVDLFALGLLGGLGPYGFHVGRRVKRIRELEARMPDFLRDLASSHRGGLTLTDAIRVGAQGDYGALTPEIRRMADQLAWNFPADEVLARFAYRMQTPLVQRSVNLILEAGRSGGRTTDVLMSAARSAQEIKNLEGQRKGTMSMYSIIIYIAFFVFLIVAAIMFGSFVPEIVAASDAAVRSAATGLGGLSLDVPSIDEFRSFYFMASLVQAVGNGMLAGIIESGDPRLGLRHSFIMVAISLITFAVVLA